MPVIPALGRLRQKEQEFREGEPSVGSGTAFQSTVSERTSMYARGSFPWPSEAAC